MAARALIIAIEDYPDLQGGGIAKKLPGTLEAGLNFKEWLLKKWKVEDRKEGDRQLLLCSEPKQPDGTGATRKNIFDALMTLKKDGAGATEELYFFFSGHGFSFAEKIGSRPADVVMPSDFVSAEQSGPLCWKLDEIQYWLSSNLGEGFHYYFIDACRNPLDPTTIRVSAQLPTNPQASGEASPFVLQSTAPGNVAAVGSLFPASLLAGLRGSGRAKAWDRAAPNGPMVVRFDTLRSYLKTSLKGQRITGGNLWGPDGETDAVLAKIPVTRSRCTIKIEEATGPVAGELIYQRGREAEKRQAFQDQPIILDVDPDDYAISVELRDSAVNPPRYPLVDLYEDQQLVFTSVPLGAANTQAPPTDFEVLVPQDGTFELHHPNTGEESRFSTSHRISLRSGRYIATLRGKDNEVIQRREIELSEGGNASLDLADWQNSAPHRAIAQRLPTQNGAVDFSESLHGGVTDPDLDLWLALVGGARILGAGGGYTKLAAFPLHIFSGEKEGASPIYVLAAFEDVATKLSVGITRGDATAWSDAEAVRQMPGILEYYFATEPGPKLVSFRIPDHPPYTLASLSSPNRTTLITLTMDDAGNPLFSQYLLPLGHLVDKLDPVVAKRLEWRRHLSDVRFLAQANRAFRRRRDVWKQLPPHALDDLLTAKWLDPIGSSLAAYELLRRGKKDEMDEVVDNMMRFFPDVPDTHALARLAGRKIDRPNGVPLFLDGLRAFPDHDEWLPFPRGHLDFSSPWTMWLAAV